MPKSILKDMSTETQLATRPQKFAANQNTKILTRVDAPPFHVGRGRKRSPLVSLAYAELLENMNTWFHVNIPFATKKEMTNFATNLYNRSQKDNLSLSRSTAYNEVTKTYDLWILLSR